MGFSHIDQGATAVAQKRKATESAPVAKKAKALPIRVTINDVEQPVEMDESFTALPSKLRKKCEAKFPSPTPIQAVAWPLLLKQKDVIAIAKTGSGKTLGFTVPFLAMSEAKVLEYWSPTNCPRMVCLAPTRELAQQIAKVVEEFGDLSKSRVKYPCVTMVGGLSKGEQCKAVRTCGCDIVVGTPGRVQDMINDQIIDVSYVQMFVLDEGDRMLDMGFVDVVRDISKTMPKKRQTVLFSATWPDSVQAFARTLVRTSELVQISVGEGESRPRANDSITQVVEVVLQRDAKWPKLLALLKEAKAKKVIVFGLYKKECAWLHTALQREGYSVGCLQGDMSQQQRSQNIDDFKAHRLPMLVATDVAGRGLDVEDVELVVNYTFPLTIEDYVHRIGRTGRAGKLGKSVTYFCPNDIEKALADDLVTVLKESKQVVPDDLLKISNSAGGFKASKKKTHSLYGSHFKDAGEMAKLEAKKVHVSFDSDDDE